MLFEIRSTFLTVKRDHAGQGPILILKRGAAKQGISQVEVHGSLVTHTAILLLLLLLILLSLLPQGDATSKCESVPAKSGWTLRRLMTVFCIINHISAHSFVNVIMHSPGVVVIDIV